MRGVHSPILRVGDRVHLRPVNGLGTIRYIEGGAACVKWDGLPKIYTYDLDRLEKAAGWIEEPRIPSWAAKLQRSAR